MNINEEQMATAIADFCQDDTLYFQIIIQARTLHIYVNRQTDTLNYSELTVKIKTAVIAKKWSQVEAIWLYSRLLGEFEPDWQTFVKIKDSGTTTVEDVGLLVKEIESEVNNTEQLVAKLQSQPETAIAQITAGMKTTKLLLTKLKKQLE